MENSLGTYIILIFLGLFIAFCVGTCNNSLADGELAKVSTTAKTEYQEYNSESWFNGIVGGDARKKTVYATYLGIAKENKISVYEAVKNTRSKFAGQFKNKFRSLNAMISLPNVRNVTRTEINGKPAVIVHYTWENCNNDHCYTEHDEVTIPEINVKTYNDWETVN
jgi:hypothetical protein